MDKEVLAFICDSIEDCLGLADSRKGITLKDEKVVKLLKEISQANHNIRPERGSELITHVGLLSYMTERADFNNVVMLDFSEFDDSSEISKLIGETQYKKDLDRKAQKRMDQLVSILSYIEKKSIATRYSLEFRYLVLYLIFLDKYMFTEARIVQRLIKNQIGR